MSALVLSTYALYACTDAAGPTWKRTPWEPSYASPRLPS